jgi:hypothetical protein
MGKIYTPQMEEKEAARTKKYMCLSHVAHAGNCYFELNIERVTHKQHSLLLNFLSLVGDCKFLFCFKLTCIV